MGVVFTPGLDRANVYEERVLRQLLIPVVRLSVILLVKAIVDWVRAIS